VGQPRQHSANVRKCRSVVGDAELEVRIGLLQNRVDRRLEPRSLRIVHRHDETDDRAAGIRLGEAAHGRELRRSRGVQHEPAPVLAPAGGSGVSHADGPPQVAVTTDQPCQRRWPVVDECQRPGCGPVQGLLTARLRGNHSAHLADDCDSDPGGCAAGGLGKLGPDCLELGLELGDMAPRRAQLFAEPVNLIAGGCHGTDPGAIAVAILTGIERRW
jgi:hypothetical protein